MGRKVCILGRSSRHNHLAPYDDPSVEFWVLSQDTPKRADLVFEIHDNPEFRKRLDNFKCRRITTLNYPYKEVEAFLTKHNAHKDYLMSSIGYMLAMAIMDDTIDTIYLYGVDMATTTEYSYQKSNCEFLLGVASGLGKKIIMPKECLLLNSVAKYGTQEHLRTYFK